MKYRVLVVGSGDKIFDFIAALLPKSSFDPVLRAKDSGEARRMLLSTAADVVIINAPLTDEFGTELALDLAEGTCGVVLLVKNELYEQISFRVEDSGVLTLAKPMSSQGLYSAVKLAAAMSARLGRMERRNQTLQEKMNDIRIVNRAKWLLIEHLRMTEEDAHYLIEKKAMDARLSRREIAQEIIRSYEK